MSKTAVSAPSWLASFYAKFPLVTLEQDDHVDWHQPAGSSPYTLWIQPASTGTHVHRRAWASTDPACLRAQLLFLLRGIPTQFRPWTNQASAPGGKLPTLHVMSENKLVGADDIRHWLDTTHPLTGPSAKYQGLPSQSAYDDALATAQLILVRLLPAYLASSGVTSNLALMFSDPPPLLAGLTTPLPANLTGDERALDVASIVGAGVTAIEALQRKVGEGWALGAEHPTPLDALIASHLYCIYTLPASSPLRLRLEDSSELGSYVDRVLRHAERQLS